MRRRAVRRVVSERLAVSAIMAFVPTGPEASFFDALDRHRASLLAVVKQGAGEAPAGVTRVVSRYSRSAGKGRPGRWPRGRRRMPAPTPDPALHRGFLPLALVSSSKKPSEHVHMHAGCFLECSSTL